MKKKPDAVEKLALKWVIDGHEAGGIKAIRRLIAREVKAERERCVKIVVDERSRWRGGIIVDVLEEMKTKMKGPK